MDKFRFLASQILAVTAGEDHFELSPLRLQALRQFTTSDVIGQDDVRGGKWSNHRSELEEDVTEKLVPMVQADGVGT